MNRLLITTALMPEAVPLIDFYRLKKQAKQPFYHCYQSSFAGNEPEIHLLVCGLGATNMYRGLKAYLDAADQTDQILYLNFGIAGALDEPRGKLLWAGSVGLTSIGLPEGVQNLPYRVSSQDEASSDYQPGVLFDMEAEAWLQCIAENTHQFTPAALFCAKVVSDNRSQNILIMGKHWVRNIVFQNIIELDIYINKLIKSLE